MSWIYQQTEPNLYTVGFYNPKGEWKTDSDFNNKRDAANRALELNGGQSFDAKRAKKLEESLCDMIELLERTIKECGGFSSFFECDHSVNICSCHDKSKFFYAKGLLVEGEEE